MAWLKVIAKDGKDEEYIFGHFHIWRLGKKVGTEETELIKMDLLSHQSRLIIGLTSSFSLK